MVSFLFSYNLDMQLNTSNKKSVIFFGTPKIAATCLQALLDSRVNVIAVVTKPDRPVGRKHQIIFSEVKQLAIKNNLKLFQPEDLDDIYEQIKELNPDLIFSCAYGKIIPNNILSIPKLKCVNVHPSLLPKYRGATPIQSVIINNEKETGVSFMYMVEKLDAGDILFQEKISIDENETSSSLFIKAEKLSYDMICKHIHQILENRISPIQQNDSLATFCKTIKREDEKIDWSKSSKEIECLVRGLCDTPAAYTSYDNQLIKVYEVKINNSLKGNFPGEIIKVDKDGICVSTSDGSILLKVIKLSGQANKVNVSNLLNGNHPFKIGKKFE